MTIDEIKGILEPLGAIRVKRRYMAQGAREPLYGLTIKSMKPLAKELLSLENCQQIAYDLFDTGNYDLMYLAGMIVNTQLMTEEKFHQWMAQSYCWMLGDWTVAVCLSENEDGLEIAKQFIETGKELYLSAGYHTYCWALASKPDRYFEQEDLRVLLNTVEKTIHNASNRGKYAMYYFVYNLGVSYKPLHQGALMAAKNIGEVKYTDESGKVQILSPKKAIEIEIEKGHLGFKRKNVRC